MASPRGISGYPEWLPEQRMVEQHVLRTLAETFELYGFAPIETRAVEPLDQLLKQGETDKEIYVIRRLQAEEDEGHANLGLHYDLTVPFARYVAEYRHKLTFPFRRYQIQKSWRGERPQEGRFREFYQADIDVVAQDELSVDFDAEMLVLLHEVLACLPLPPVTIRVNNRKILEGFYLGLGIEDVQSVLRTVDKLDKIGRENVLRSLVDDVGLPRETAERCLRLGEIRATDASFGDQIRALDAAHPLLRTGVAELETVMAAASHLPRGRVVADLSVARGFDYYTGTVYEGVMDGYEPIGSVCSGGRYDDLVGRGSKQKFPGVGVSIGVTRILSRMFATDVLTASRRTPSCVLVALASDDRRVESVAIARSLRARGIACEVFHKAQKYGKQIRHAERLGIPFVWFTEAEDGGAHQVRDIRSGEQHPADPATWMPPESDRRVTLITQS